MKKKGEEGKERRRRDPALYYCFLIVGNSVIYNKFTVCLWRVFCRVCVVDGWFTAPPSQSPISLTQAR